MQLSTNASNGARNTAFTMIELLVVLFVIALVAALTLSAVMAAREASRRTYCANNLRQIGIGIHAYSDAIKSFPQGINGNGFSLHSMILPYVDNASVYNSINFDALPRMARHRGIQNLTVSKSSISLFVCQSDNGSGRAANNYAGNRGCGVQKYGYNGAFPLEDRAPIGYSAFRDGTATTVAMTEWITGVTSRSRSESERLVFDTGISLIRPEELEQFAETCRNLDADSATLSPSIKGRSWLIGELSFTMYTHVLKANEKSCTNNTLVQEGAWTAGSYHRAGVNILFVDGHTSFVRESIALGIWRAIGSRDGGEVIPETSL